MRKSSILKIYKFIPWGILLFIAVFLYRVPTIGFDFINNDDHHWKTRGYAFSTALSELDFAKTAVTYHPGVTLLWSQFGAIKTYGILNKLGYTPEFFNISEFFLNHFIQNLFIVLFTSVITYFLYLGLNKIWGKKLSILFVVVLCAEPFYTALTRTIHLDALMSLFMFSSFIYLFLYFHEKVNKLITWNSIVAGVFLGLALLTKSAALFMLPFIIVASLYFAKYRGFEMIWKKSVFVIAISLATFFLVWPAMWVIPIEALNMYFVSGVKGTAIDTGHMHNWFGSKTADPGFLFYPVAILARFSMVLVFSAIFGVWYFIRNMKKIAQKDKDFLILCAIFFGSFLLMISLASKKLDRYEIPLIFSVVAWAVYYFKYLDLSLKKWFGLISVYICSAGIIFYGIHPNYLAYYSPLIGGYDEGRYVIEPMWLVGYDKVADHFNEMKNPEEISIAIADRDYLIPFAKFRVYDLNDPGDRERAQYFVFPSYRSEDSVKYINSMNLRNTGNDIEVAGVEYYKIYKRRSIDE